MAEGMGLRTHLCTPAPTAAACRWMVLIVLPIVLLWSPAWRTHAPHGAGVG